MPKIIEAKIKDRIKELILDHSLVIDEDIKSKRMKVSCEAIANMLFSETREDVSDRTIAGLLAEMNIEPMQRGGPRQGAGRPQGSLNKSGSSRECRGHKLTISDVDVVGWCSSVYDYDQGKLVLSLVQAGVKSPHLTNLPRSWKPGLAFGGGGSLGKQGGRSDRSMIISSMK